jgi:hypothetical protein
MNNRKLGCVIPCPDAVNKSAASALLFTLPRCHPERVRESASDFGRDQRGIPRACSSREPLHVIRLTRVDANTKTNSETRVSLPGGKAIRFTSTINYRCRSYQRLQPDFLAAGFFLAAFLAARFGLRALFFALRAVFFLRVAMIPPSGMLEIIIGQNSVFNASESAIIFWTNRVQFLNTPRIK